MTAALAIGRNGRPLVETCKNGHPYTPENTYRRPDGSRACHICRRERRLRARTSASRIERLLAPAADPLVVNDPSGLWEILGKVARTAIDDYLRNVEPGAHMPAAAFLAAAGLLLPDGTIDTRGMHLAPPRTRRKI